MMRLLIAFNIGSIVRLLEFKLQRYLLIGRSNPACGIELQNAAEPKFPIVLTDSAERVGRRSSET